MFRQSPTRKVLQEDTEVHRSFKEYTGIEEYSLIWSHNPGIWLEEQHKTMRNTSQNSHAPHQDLMLGPSKYKATAQPNDFNTSTYTLHKTSQSISFGIRLVYWRSWKWHITQKCYKHWAVVMVQVKIHRTNMVVIHRPVKSTINLYTQMEDLND
jgi:hypothetical protein